MKGARHEAGTNKSQAASQLVDADCEVLRCSLKREYEGVPEKTIQSSRMRAAPQVTPGPFDQRWYAYVDNKTYGPYSGHDIRTMVAKGEILASDLVSVEGGSSWVQAKDDPVLRLLFVKATGEVRPKGFSAKRGRRINAIAGLLVLVTLGWIAWPYYSAYAIFLAMQDGDTTALENGVNWESVRQGLRGDLNALYLKNAGKEQNDMGRGLAVLFGPAVINQMVEGYVTPQAIGNLIRTGKPTVPSGSAVTGTPATANNHVRLDSSRVAYAFFSGGPLTFRVDVRPDKSIEMQGITTLLFKWSGDWKLARVILPIDEIQEFTAKNAR